MVLTEHCEAMACKCFSRSLNFCEGVTGGFPSKRPVIQSFDVFVGVTLHKLLNKHSSSQWNEAHIVIWRHCYALKGFAYKGGVMISFSVNSNSSPGLCVQEIQTFVIALAWYWQGLSHVRTGGNCIENVDTNGVYWEDFRNDLSTFAGFAAYIHFIFFIYICVKFNKSWIHLLPVNSSHNILLPSSGPMVGLIILIKWKHRVFFPQNMQTVSLRFDSGHYIAVLAEFM